jgi:quinol monooxygenase YgiN
MTQPITVIAFLKAKPGAEAALRAEMLKVVELTRKEAGCLQYDLHVHTADPTRFAYYETWDSEASLAGHAQAERMNAFREFRKDMLDGPVVVETYKRIA